MEKRMYQSKANTLHECERKFHLYYNHHLAPKIEPKPFKTGRIFHKMAQLYLEQDVGAAVFYVEELEELTQEDKTHFRLMFSSLKETLDSQKFQLLGTEKAVALQVDIPTLGSIWYWYTKPDLLFTENGNVWVGDYKTTSGFGPATAAFYHKAPVTFIYQKVLLSHYDKLYGTRFFITTKAKDPKTHPEDVLVNETNIRWAERAMFDTLRKVEFCYEADLWPREHSHCKTTRSECPYLPLCFIVDKNLWPYPNVSKGYVEEIRRLFHEKDPDEHLELEVE